MSIRNRWLAFINSMAERMERSDPKFAEHFRSINEFNIPPDENSLQWGMAYVRSQQAMGEFIELLMEQGRPHEALLVSEAMIELNDKLKGGKDIVRIPMEFVKEAYF